MIKRLSTSGIVAQKTEQPANFLAWLKRVALIELSGLQYQALVKPKLAIMSALFKCDRYLADFA